MKVNLNKNVTDLDGKEVAGNNIGKTVAQVLSSANGGDPLKLMNWATKLHNGETLDLDPTDTQTFKDFIVGSQVFSNLWKARILESLTDK